MLKHFFFVTFISLFFCNFIFSQATTNEQPKWNYKDYKSKIEEFAKKHSTTFYKELYACAQNFAFDSYPYKIGKNPANLIFTENGTYLCLFYEGRKNSDVTKCLINDKDNSSINSANNIKWYNFEGQDLRAYHGGEEYIKLYNETKRNLDSFVPFAFL